MSRVRVRNVKSTSGAKNIRLLVPHAAVHHELRKPRGTSRRRKMVVLNRIYTRTGDDGTTALGSGERRPKYDLRIAAYGTVDELNAVIGLARLHTRTHAEMDAMQARIQNDLFDLGADLSTPDKAKGPGGERP